MILVVIIAFVAVLRNSRDNAPARLPFERASITLITENGKIDYRSLPEPRRWMAEPRSVRAPESAAEIAIARVWEELLETRNVGGDWATCQLHKYENW